MVQFYSGIDKYEKGLDIFNESFGSGQRRSRACDRVAVQE